VVGWLLLGAELDRDGGDEAGKALCGVYLPFG